ncbi:flagellar hook-basal body complex protein [Clostridium estertheticum]|uniref:flagellar hook-basal body complex protein n=1 Tax=Clostridium estertheticum TaxID=238834 RepID=UPI001CF1A2E1|nr:flagellar hook-basal body complex protein [Clostridium estertheticum]MCB2356661.1 flagellar basal body rod protein FlgG [Clostridium estertheticum]WAG42809.1 flagellar basal body rod protein FlgG [Clostridium estertheticum]
MLRIIWDSKSAMMAQQEKLDTISNNIANVNTNGYKKLNTNFKDLVYETIDRKGYPVSTASKTTLQNGTGVRVGEWKRDNTQGALTQTGLSTDLAIDGAGYFEVIQPDNTKAYTRAGNFLSDASETIVDEKGNRLSIVDASGKNINTVNGRYKFTANNFQVDESGNVSIKGVNGTVGKIKISTVVGDNSMISIGDNLFQPKPGTKVVDSKDYSINQGYLEGSNVDIATEMTDMLMTQRAFQLSSSTLKTADEMWQMANNLRG